MNSTKFSTQYILHMFLIPAFVLTFFFSYLPMFSNVIAFMHYNMFKGWMGLGSEWVGFDNFAFLKEQWFYKLAFRTLYFNITMLLFSFPASLILALLLNELKSHTFKKYAQTISYVPHFVSWVTVASLVYIFLSVDISGLVNNLKVALFGGERILFMQDKDYFLPVLVISQVWKEIGWGSILYLAAISTVDPQLYEAATVEGAGRWKQMLHITLPCLAPTTVIIMIFSVASMFGGNFDQIITLQNQVIQADTNIIGTDIYYRGVKGANYSVAMAVGLFSGLISFILLRIANYSGKKIADTSVI